MASVFDVAAFIQQNLGWLSVYKLQKLVYYAQAWSLAWDRRPLFPQVIKAWSNGPVSPELWHENKRGLCGNAAALQPDEVATITAVVDFYGQLSPHDLIELSHREAPWRAARVGIAKGNKGTQPISHESMRHYYESMATAGEKRISGAVRRGVEYLLAIPEDRLDDLIALDDVAGDDLLKWLEADGSDPWEEL